ncbi:MAG: hypothetical protein GY702_22670 [Desulfobulbaceae bacterium]|nr:hypothetical protein [Desulfobulbaceae bacterium]
MSEHMAGHPVSRATYGTRKCRCDGCRAAHAAYMRRFRQRAAAALIESVVEVQHGTASTYKNYRCGCGPCREANRIAQRRYRATARRREADK